MSADGVLIEQGRRKAKAENTLSANCFVSGWQRIPRHLVCRPKTFGAWRRRSGSSAPDTVSHVKTQYARVKIVSPFR